MESLEVTCVVQQGWVLGSNSLGDGHTPRPPQTLRPFAAMFGPLSSATWPRPQLPICLISH